MPDDPKPDDKPAADDKKGATPAIDMEALGALLDTKIKAGVTEALAAQPGAQPAKTETGVPKLDPLGEMVRGYVGPELQRAQIAAEAAADLATFYTSGDDDELDWRKSQKPEIEKVFGQMMKAGRPMSREDIANWVKGKDPDKVVEYKGKRKQARTDRAVTAGLDAGASGGRPPQAGDTSGKTPHDMSDEELDKAAGGGKWF